MGIGVESLPNVTDESSISDKLNNIGLINLLRPLRLVIQQNGQSRCWCFST